MITFEEAYHQVLNATNTFGEVSVPFSKADGRVLAEDVFADRDFPPYDRATKDGIAIQFDENSSNSEFKIAGVAPAGMPQLHLDDRASCYEIMTGAIVPEGANTVVMYEHLVISNGTAKITTPIKMGQNIHYKGSDESSGNLVLKKGTLISAAEIGVLATVGKSEVLVQKNPQITLFSTGDELVSIDSIPQTHQIRQSNSHTIRAALHEWGIASEIVHVRDDEQGIHRALKKALETSDVLLMSGGVSKGKFDFLPEVLGTLGVKKKFHRVSQRPGKPFWFGVHESTKTTIFGFPGNPTSTFANFNVYFIPWLKSCWGLPIEEIQAVLVETFENTIPLTCFVRAKAFLENGNMKVRIINGNGSGDLTSLVHANGFIKMAPKAKAEMNEKVVFIPTRKIVS